MNIVSENFEPRELNFVIYVGEVIMNSSELFFVIYVAEVKL